MKHPPEGPLALLAGAVASKVGREASKKRARVSVSLSKTCAVRARLSVSSEIELACEPADAQARSILSN